MNLNIKPSEMCVPLCALPPSVVDTRIIGADFEPNTPFTDLQHFQSFLAVFSIGYSNQAALTFKVTQAKNFANTEKDIPGKISAFYPSGGGYVGKHVLINFNFSDLDAANGYNLASLKVLIGSSAIAHYSAMLFGFDARHRPNTKYFQVDSII